MVFIFLSIVSFLLSTLTFIFWHVRKKHNSMKRMVFVRISICWLIAYVALSTILYHYDYLGIESGYDRLCLPLIGSSVVLYLLLIPVFLQYYFMAYIESPSGRIMYLIGKSGRMSFEELEELIPENTLIMPRLSSMEENGYIEADKRRYYALLKGERVVQMMKLFQRVFGFEKGG